MQERPSVTIRKFDQKDRLDVVTLVEENGLVDGRAAGYLQGVIDKRKILVADSNGLVVGTVIINGPKKHHMADISYVAVNENFRRFGIGKILVNHAEKILRSMNVRAINLLAHEARPELINFYSNLGFVLVTPEGEMVKRLRK